MDSYDVSGLHGVVRGFSVSDVESGRASLQTLMMAYGFDVIERDGMLVFEMRGRAKPASLADTDFVEPEDSDPIIETVRAPNAETAGAVRIGYAADGSDFDVVVAEARFPDDGGLQTTQPICH